ncbi:hypothetical protein IF188_10180 [Microbacterium sp. NEAU-LLC]|uniref:Uncharacterized protein n=1 Tax=Microbacterium helvum TaxID=2773713 RepID=A0ABR8NN27_9MICO|nr:hypothetical protein [Microbacterium helvum]MBD3942063.1 hypothetical protein [Microbacterium helvum]
MTIHTDKGHRVHVIEGDAQGIISRGNEISRLGGQMIGAAGLLEAVADGATEERGRSITRIKDEVGDAHKDLRKAGERYKPTGTAMTAYGNSLSEVQAKLRPLVAEIEEAKRSLDAKNEAAQEAQRTADQSADYDPEDSAAKSTADADRWEAREAGIAAGNAYTYLHNLLDDFDGQWQVWDEAYDKALGDVTDATHGNVSDRWVDDIADFVEIVVEIIGYVGIVVAIAALVIGGPIVALIGTVLAVIALVGTVLLMFADRADGGDLAWAIVGVLPFGRLGQFFKAGSRAQGFKFLAGPIFEITDSISDIRRLRGIRVAVEAVGEGRGLGQVARAGLASRVADTFSGFRWRDLMSRSTFIENARRGGGAWTMNIADEFADFSRHHTDIIRDVTNVAHLDDFVARGQEVFNKGQYAMHGLDFGAKLTTLGHDIAGGITSRLEKPYQPPAELDRWREQLAA